MDKRIGYLLAFLVGVIPGFFIIFKSIFSDSSGAIWERLITFILVIVVYGILGVIFGWFGKETSWRWGIWIGLPAFLLLFFYLFKEPSLFFLIILYGIVTLATGSAAAYFGARVGKGK